MRMARIVLSAAILGRFFSHTVRSTSLLLCFSGDRFRDLEARTRWKGLFAAVHVNRERGFTAYSSQDTSTQNIAFCLSYHVSRGLLGLFLYLS